MKNLILLIATVSLFCSCSKEAFNQTEPLEKEYTIRLLPIGDISATYSPLTKSETSEIFWYGINIKRDGANYLFGIYDDISQFKVQLSTAHSYSFEISAIKTNEDIFEEISGKLYYASLDYTAIAYVANFPFDYDRELYYAGYNGNWRDVHNDPNAKLPKSYYLNKLYSQLLLYTYFDSSCYNLKEKTNDKQYVNRLCHLSIGKNTNEWYRYYGTKNNFTPSQDEILPFTLKHEGFGLQYSVNGICDGSVSIKIDNAQESNTVTYFSQPAITTNYTSPQKVIEFRDMTAETEQVKVSVIWTRGNNVVDDLGSTTVNVLRNKVNKINISLGDHSSNKSMSITTDATDYAGSEEKTITI